jgi:hypothetical protein
LALFYDAKLDVSVGTASARWLSSDETSRAIAAAARSNLMSDQDHERAKHSAEEMRPRAAPPHIIEMMRRREVQEEIRRVQEGLGRPIISTMFKGHRMVAVGNQMKRQEEDKSAKAE